MVTSTATRLSVEPQTFDLHLYGGDGFACLVQYVDSVSGAPFPMDGVWAAEIRVHEHDAAPVDAFTVDTSGMAAGDIRLSLSGAQLAALAAGGDVYVWDLQQIPAGAGATQPRTWYRGDLRVDEDVTR
jgi:hypothetical protein